MLEALLNAVLGVASGMRHAMEPDHLAAVSTVVAERKSARSSLLYAATWGLGHALTLLLVGGSLLLVRHQMPEGLAVCFELMVAVMLIGLGVRALVLAKRMGGAAPAEHHAHSRHQHDHGGATAHVHVGTLTFATRPLMIGMMHGVAGSGALTALIAARMGSTAKSLTFIGLYGLGAMIGMAMLAGLLGIPLAKLAKRPGGAFALLAVTGLISVGMGVFWGFSTLRALN